MVRARELGLVLGRAWSVVIFGLVLNFVGLIQALRSGHHTVWFWLLLGELSIIAAAVYAAWKALGQRDKLQERLDEALRQIKELADGERMSAVRIGDGAKRTTIRGVYGDGALVDVEHAEDTDIGQVHRRKRDEPK